MPQLTEWRCVPEWDGIFEVNRDGVVRRAATYFVVQGKRMSMATAPSELQTRGAAPGKPKLYYFLRRPVILRKEGSRDQHMWHIARTYEVWGDETNPDVPKRHEIKVQPAVDPDKLEMHRKIVNLYASGMTQAGIARKLGISNYRVSRNLEGLREAKYLSEMSEEKIDRIDRIEKRIGYKRESTHKNV